MRNNPKSNNSNPFSQNLTEEAGDAKKGADITVEVVADWTFKALGAVAAGVIIYNAVNANNSGATPEKS